MKIVTLNRTNSTKAFKFSTADSYLRIINISLILDDDLKSNWIQLASNFHLKITMIYVVYEDPEGRYIDDRQVEVPIYLRLAPNQTQPIFAINQLIKNEVFKIGQAGEEKFFTTIKIELIEREVLNENYNLQIEVEKFQAEDC